PLTTGYLMHTKRDMSKTLREETDPCPIAPLVETIFGRWTSHVLWVLNHLGRQRFTDLRAHIPGITPRVLTQRLRQLERDGFVTRTYHPSVPPRVEYEATELARSLSPLFAQMVQWTDEHYESVEAARISFAEKSRAE